MAQSYMIEIKIARVRTYPDITIFLSFWSWSFCLFIVFLLSFCCLFFTLLSFFLLFLVFFVFFVFLSFCLFVWPSLRSNVWRVSSVKNKSNSLCQNSKVALSDSVTQCPRSGGELPGQLKIFRLVKGCQKRSSRSTRTSFHSLTGDKTR